MLQILVQARIHGRCDGLTDTSQWIPGVVFSHEQTYNAQVIREAQQGFVGKLVQIKGNPYLPLIKVTPLGQTHHNNYASLENSSISKMAQIEKLNLVKLANNKINLLLALGFHK